MLMRVGAKRHLQRQTGLAHRAACGMRLLERRPWPLPFVGLLRITVKTHLHRPNRKPSKPLGRVRVEALAVGFDLEVYAGRTERLGHREEMWNDQRLAAAQHHIGNAAAHDVVGNAQRLARVELVIEFLPRCRLGTAMQAREIAVARQLPRDEKRRAEAIDAVHCGRFRRHVIRPPS
jgi:hypothetical protein